MARRSGSQSPARTWAHRILVPGPSTAAAACPGPASPVLSPSLSSPDLHVRATRARVCCASGPETHQVSLPQCLWQGTSPRRRQQTTESLSGKVDADKNRSRTLVAFLRKPRPCTETAPQTSISSFPSSKYLGDTSSLSIMSTFSPTRLGVGSGSRFATGTSGAFPLVSLSTVGYGGKRDQSHRSAVFSPRSSRRQIVGGKYLGGPDSHKNAAPRFPSFWWAHRR